MHLQQCFFKDRHYMRHCLRVALGVAPSWEAHEYVDNTIDNSYEALHYKV